MNTPSASNAIVSSDLRLVQALLAGKAPDMDALKDPQVIDSIKTHGLMPWARWRLKRLDLLAELPSKVRDTLDQEARNLAVQEMEWEQELARLATDLGNLQVVVFKGTDLAHRVYPTSGLRPCCDVDLLVRKSDYPDLSDLLVSLGYERLTAIDAPMISRQACFCRTTTAGMRIALDVHWELSNRPALIKALPAGGFISAAVPAKNTLSGLMVPSLIDALLIACSHRIAHHRSNRRWIWLMDIDLLWRKLSVTDRRRFCEKAVAMGIGAICADGLEAARGIFDTAISDSELKLMRAHQDQEPSAYLLSAPINRWADLKFDFRSLPNSREKMTFLRQHALPDSTYMRAKFGQKSNLLLPYYYLKRAWRGTGKVLGQLFRSKR